MIRRGAFLIEPTPGNRSGSIPKHWDIFIEDSDDSIVTVWDSLAMAELVTDALVTWADRRQAERLEAVRA